MCSILWIVLWLAYGTSYGAYYGQTYTPYGSGYQPAYQSPNYVFVPPHPLGIPKCNMQTNMGQTRVGYYPIGQGHGVYNNQPYVNQPYQDLVTKFLNLDSLSLQF